MKPYIIIGVAIICIFITFETTYMLKDLELKDYKQNSEAIVTSLTEELAEEKSYSKDLRESLNESWDRLIGLNYQSLEMFDFMEGKWALYKSDYPSLFFDEIEFGHKLGYNYFLPVKLKYGDTEINAFAYAQSDNKPYGSLKFVLESDKSFEEVYPYLPNDIGYFQKVDTKHIGGSGNELLLLQFKGLSPLIEASYERQ